jgi:hypothetical protein
MSGTGTGTGHRRPTDVDCPELLQNLLHRPGFVLLNIKNTVTFKSRFISKYVSLVAKNQLDRRTFLTHSNKTLTGECNRLVSMLAPAEHDRDATLALCDIPQTDKPEIHELTARYLLTSFLGQSLEFGV